MRALLSALPGLAAPPAAQLPVEALVADPRDGSRAAFALENGWTGDTPPPSTTHRLQITAVLYSGLGLSSFQSIL